MFGSRNISDQTIWDLSLKPSNKFFPNSHNHFVFYSLETNLIDLRTIFIVL